MFASLQEDVLKVHKNNKVVVCLKHLEMVWVYIMSKHARSLTSSVIAAGVLIGRVEGFVFLCGKISTFFMGCFKLWENIVYGRFYI